MTPSVKLIPVDRNVEVKPIKVVEVLYQVGTANRNDEVKRVLAVAFLYQVGTRGL